MTASLADLLHDAPPVLFAFAHPDDETLACGTLIAQLAVDGASVGLVTGTRGEQGEVLPGPLAHLAGTTRLAAHREHELACALDRLGVERHCWLGAPPARADGMRSRRYQDSGMRWVRPGLAGPAAELHRDALCAARVDEICGDVAALLAAWRPRLVIGDDAAGGYGHPDHLRMREAALRAATAAGIPFAELVTEPGEDVLWCDGTGRTAQVVDALACHASQVAVDGAEVVHPGGRRTPIVTSVGLRLVT